MKKLFVCLIACLVSSMVFAAQQLPPGAAVDVGFSPNAGALEVVLKGIDSSRSSILVAAYSFTSKPVALALLAAQKRGVKVAVVADEKDNSKSYSATRFLANQGVPVRLNGNYATLHSKFMVIDGQNVQLGSFNYSAAAASKNEENAMLLWNVKQLASVYGAEWQKLWNEGTDLRPAY
jgi:phosphatidylserine/phosphatidylglycerophosphate/cardiolipin synthase-like enzyme